MCGLNSVLFPLWFVRVCVACGFVRVACVVSSFCTCECDLCVVVFDRL